MTSIKNRISQSGREKHKIILSQSFFCSVSVTELSDKHSLQQKRIYLDYTSRLQFATQGRQGAEVVGWLTLLPMCNFLSSTAQTKNAATSGLGPAPSVNNPQTLPTTAMPTHKSNQGHFSLPVLLLVTLDCIKLTKVARASATSNTASVIYQHGTLCHHFIIYMLMAWLPE